MISGDGGSQGDMAEFSEETAGEILRESCGEAGLDPSGAELVRLGSNAVYRLASSPVIVRIARNPTVADEMDRAVRVARWLKTEDFPATRVVPEVEQPLTVAGRVVTFWESAQEQEEYATLDELADLLKRLHWLEEPESLRLPYFEPFVTLWDGLRALDGVVSEDDRTFLEDRAGKLQKEYDRLDFVLPFGMIHGDANIGNVIRHRDGSAILIDLDGFALAPREWDLILTAIYYDRYGWHTRAEYESFVYRYGFDVMNWPGYPVLADLRELKMVVWVGHQASTSEWKAEEFARRMNSLRTGGSRRDWRPS